jgi:AcrR family transcriptional regulator
MPKVSQDHRDARREQILDAAVHCFVRKGVHATTMADICAAARLSRGAVYGYFESKYEIIQAAFESWQGESQSALAAVEQAPDQDLALFQMLESFFFAVAGKGERERDLLKLDQLLKGEAVHDDAILALARRQVAQLRPAFATKLRALQKAGTVDPKLNAEYVLRCCWALHDGLKAQLILDPDLDVRKFVATMRAVLKFWPKAK